MKVNRRYLVAVALLAVLAVVFGVVGTVAPPLAEETALKPQQEYSSSSSDSVAHFQNPPTYDSGWIDIRSKAGQYFTLKHNLNTTQVVVDIAGKQSLDPTSGTLAWSKTYGGADFDYAYSSVQTSDGGYAIAGYTYSFGSGAQAYLVKTKADGTVTWNKTYGGGSSDYASSLVQTDDGGYALAGFTYSYSSGGCDSWLVKADSTGNIMWNKTYGGTNYDYAESLVQTSDGGFALAGNTDSFGAGGQDFYLVKTDSSGTMEWNKTYGGTGRDCARSVVETGDGGYALAGWTDSYGGGYGFLLVKTDAVGGMLWSKTYGGVGIDVPYSVVQTSDDGYALAGYTDSYGIDTPGRFNMYLVKTYADGTMAWNKTYGGASDDYALSVVETGDGGYALAGNTYPYDVYIGDALLVKADSAGNLQWNQTYGGSGDDCARSVVETSDGGYALAGYTESFGARGRDFYLAKVKPERNLEHRRNLGGTGVSVGWSKTYGGGNDDYANSVVQADDGGYVIAGCTQSYSAAYKGDFYLVKTDEAGNMMWNRTYGGTNDDLGYSVVETSDGGYAIAGYTYSFGSGAQAYLIKTNADGAMLWNRTYGGTSSDSAVSLVETNDGGYAMAGFTGSYGAGEGDFWLVKTDSFGNALWNKTYGGEYAEIAYSVVQTSDEGYALAGWANSSGVDFDFWLVKTDSFGNSLWNKTYGGKSADWAYSLVQTVDGGYAIAGFTNSSAAGYDFYLVKTDAVGNMVWNRTYGGTNYDMAYSVVETSDGGYAIAGYTYYSADDCDSWLVKTDAVGNMLWSRTHGEEYAEIVYSMVQTVDGGYALAGGSFSNGGYTDSLLIKTDTECGLTQTGLTANTITVYRGRTDPYWNYMRVRMWLIKEPSWIYGDINMDGMVDAKDLYILGRNYGKSVSLLSLSGIIGIAGICTVKKRKQSKQPSYIS